MKSGNVIRETLSKLRFRSKKFQEKEKFEKSKKKKKNSIRKIKKITFKKKKKTNHLLLMLGFRFFSFLCTHSLRFQKVKKSMLLKLFHKNRCSP